MSIMQLLTQKQIEQYIKDNAELKMFKWADVMEYTRTKVRYGEITITLRDGVVDKIESTKVFYRPSSSKE